jgi:predicted glycosyltransferase
MHSHDSFGLGHLRRTLTIAASLVDQLPNATVLATTGSPCATNFDMPAGVEVVKLPSVTKDGEGDYVPRTLNGSLDLIDRLRRQILKETFLAFEPEIVIVDHQPVGLQGEMLEVLRLCRERGVPTILGMRDVIDEPERVAAEWSHPDIREALRSLYDRVCVYGAPEVFDPRAEYPIPPELRECVEFVGYVVRDGPRRNPEERRQLRPQVLVTLGGGEDGEAAAEAYLNALKGDPVPWDSTVVLGPLLHPARARHIKRQARKFNNVRVRSFYSDLPRLLAESDAVVSMAGYNTVTEILQARVPAVLMPRVYPRREQLVRARRLESLGLVAGVVGTDPGPIRRAVRRALTVPTDWSRAPELVGRKNMCTVVEELLAAPASLKKAPVR